MALSKETVIDKIEILEDGSMQVRRATYIVENGARIFGPEYSRSAYIPGEDVTTEDSKVKDVATLIWTPAVVQAARDRRNNGNPNN